MFFSTKLKLIAKIYSGGKTIQDSPLYLIVHAKPKTESNIEPKRLLAHYVMEKVVHMKWENFAKRMYLQQLVLHCLLVMTMSLSVSMSREAASNAQYQFPDQLMIWLIVGSALGIVFVLLYGYKPSYSSDWKGITVVLLIAWYITLYFVYEKIESSTDYQWFVRVNNVIAAVASFYFLAKEIEEWLPNDWDHSDDSWLSKLILFTFYYVIMVPLGLLVHLLSILHREKEEKDYHSSAFNVFQIPTYVAVILYVISEFVTIFAGDTQIYIGIVLSFILWVLTLEYLEVHPTAGFLLPMMRAMAGDMLRFLTFYAPFQGAYTCAYYLFFQQSGEPTYDTIGNAFITTSLVVVGQINLDPFNKLTGVSFVLGYIILLTHATLAIVMLLNVIVAMMNKTMSDSFEKSKMKAIISFAECVLRCEKTYGTRTINGDDAKELIKDMLSKREDSETKVSESVMDDQVDQAGHVDTGYQAGHVDTGYQSDDDDFELKEVSTNDRIEEIQKNLNDTADRVKGIEEKLATNEATMNQVLQLLFELKKNQ
ncbi:hypothetical protein THRCLA_03735 [Thraustotheca clavata]|uniref:Ion transport domain-containing protein n=1 Tax=Thraustotheca clavata TaxID=74557 RepID=A0A1W0A156_9STRA|nr:hypothetical protein THRCLA_03735 [Thraustotheca clavata]